MMPAIKHFDPIMGVDIHIVVLPPGVPTPMPHPHIGMIIDPMDYVPILGATVFVGPLPRASAGTAGKPFPHIPMGGPFVKPPMNESEIFMGSATVLADGDPFSYTALPVLSCQDVGMISPPRKKPKRSYGMMLPTTIVIGIPMGMPVLVGGPPTINMAALGMAAVMKALGPALKKLRALQKKSARVKKISDAIHNKANKLMDKLGVPPNIRNKVHKSICTVTGHPVDVASGKLFTDAVDFQLPGPIPLKWERTWYSTSIYQGPLGHGWHHSYDVELIEDDRVVAIRMADGRPVAFPRLTEGTASFERAERLMLVRDSRGYAMDTVDGLRYRFFLFDTKNRRYKLRNVTEKTAGAQIQFEYDKQGLLRQIIDSGDRYIRLEYNDDNLLHKIFLPAPDANSIDKWICAVEYHYRDGELVQVDDALKQPWKYEYKNHLLVKETYRNNLSFYFRFDGGNHNSRCIETWGDDGIYYRKLDYDIENNITRVLNSLGHSTVYHHDGVLPNKIVDPLGNVSTVEYNQFGQVVLEKNEAGYVTISEYDDFGNLTKVTHPDGGVEAWSYDESRNLHAYINQCGGEWRYEYNNHNRLIAEIDPLGNTTRYLYSDTRLMALVDALGNEYQFSYDQHLNVCCITDPEGQKIQWRYDAHGNVVEMIDPLGNIRQFVHDKLGRVVKVKEPDGNVRHLSYDAGDNVINAKDEYYDVIFEYSGTGKLTLRSQAGAAVRFEYDKEEQLTAVINEHGKIYQFELNANGDVIQESGFDGLIRKYHRKEIGLATRVDRPGGLYSEFYYDGMGRIVRAVHSDGEQEAFQYRPDGALIKATNSATTLKFERDALGQIIKESQGDHRVASTYDALGYRIEIQSSLGYAQRITRNRCGDVTEVANGQEKTEITTFTRDALGQELQRSMPGGLQSRWQRDKLGRPVRNEITHGKIKYQRTYLWGMDDRLLKVIDRLDREVLFKRDVLGNLTSAKYSSGRFDLRVPDAIGNLFRTEACNDREFGPAGQLLVARDQNGVTRYEYDAEGNLIRKIDASDNVWRYVWRGPGLLVKVIRPDGAEVSFAYDPLGRRIKKTYRGKTTRWIWDGNTPLHEWYEQNRGANTAPHVPKITSEEDEIAADQRAARLQPLQAQAPPATPNAPFQGPITWIFEPDSYALMGKQVGSEYFPVITDHLGTPLVMFDSKGNEVWSTELDIWGNRRDLQGNPEDCPFRWPGQYEDLETGLYYNRFRYYDPAAGQYICQDPIRFQGGYELYQYVMDPTGWLDPLGLASGKGRDHVTYRGVKNGKPYTGYASAPSSANLSPEEIVSRRYSGNFDQFGGRAPQVVYSGTGVEGKRTARGLEQHYYEQDVKKHGKKNVANRQNPVGPRNKNRHRYRRAANRHLKKTCQ